MKDCAMFCLPGSGLLGGSAGWAEEAPSEDTLWAGVGSDGVQRVGLPGGNYFFRPKRLIVKASVPVELAFQGLSCCPP